ncbi:MAG: tetratricopeptide repeat protein [Myxococcota bacterium]|jgi:tetratricopeptide (TPR) repeat protein|nr:tetratricopeptide repeat protein [Myxococcota bacterium]
MSITTLHSLLARHEHQAVVRRLSPARSDRELELLAHALRKLGEDDEAARLIEARLATGLASHPRSLRLLARIRCARKDYDGACALFRLALQARPEQSWYRLAMGDVYRFHADEPERALAIYRAALPAPAQLRGDKEQTDRYLLRRISHILDELDRPEEAIAAFEAFLRLAPAKFYESDWARLGRCYERIGQLDRALALWLQGTTKRRGTKCLRELERAAPELAATVLLPEAPKAPPEALRIPVKTRLLTEEDEAPKVIAEAVAGVARAGDVLTFASAPAAITEGRAVSAECIDAGLLARFLKRYVKKPAYNPHQSDAPLASAVSFQLAIELAGAPRIVAAAAAGAAGKLVGQKGWFYTVAGDTIRMIDGLCGALAPYDFCVTPGPYDADCLAELICEATGHQAAIVDAHDLGLAWVVGASAGVDRAQVASFMVDNPAGNEDNQTPIILLRDAGAAAGSEAGLPGSPSIRKREGIPKG